MHLQRVFLGEKNSNFMVIVCVLYSFRKTELVFQFIFVIILPYFIKVLVATHWKLKKKIKLVLCCRELEKSTPSSPRFLSVPLA